VINSELPIRDTAARTSADGPGSVPRREPGPRSPPVGPDSYRWRVSTEPENAPPRARSPHKFIGAILLAAALALFVSWLVVLRPALDDNSAIGVDDLVNSDARAPSDGGPTAEVGKIAPDVTLKGFDGADVALSSLRGKPTVINFWASSCVPCIKEMPLIERAYAELGGDVNFVGVDVFESPDLGRDMITRTGVTYPQTVDPTNEVLTTFGGVQLPHTVVLTANGTVSALHNEAITDDEVLRDLIAAAS